MCLPLCWALACPLSPSLLFGGLSQKLPPSQHSMLSSSFAGFLRHLLLSGQVSRLIFPCQQPLCASKSRLNNQSMFPCWRMPGQASPGAKWLSLVQLRGESRRAPPARLLGASRHVFESPDESPEITALIPPTLAWGSPLSAP